MRSLRWWLGPGPVPLMVSALISVWAVLDLLAYRALEEQMARLRDRGVPMRLVQIPQPDTPEERNAALLYAEAAALAVPFEGERFSELGLPKTWAMRPVEGHEKRVRQWVVRNRRPVDLLLRAAVLPECRQSVDLWSWRLGSGGMFDSYHLLSVLEAAARVAHWDGDDARADRLLAAGLAIPRSHFGSPGLYELMTRSYEFESAVRLCMDALNGGFIPGPLLREAIRALPPGRCRSELPDALREEQTLLLERALGNRTDLRGNLPKTGAQALIGKVGWPLIVRNAAHGLSTIERLLEEGSKSEGDLLQLAEILDLEHADRSSFRRDFCPGTVREVLRVLTADMSAPVVRAALEGLASRDADGVWPDSWPALESLRDPRTGKPLTKRREGRVLVVTLMERWSGAGYGMSAIEARFTPFAGR